MRSDRDKADERGIAGQYKDLALEVRRMLGYFSEDAPLLSARQAALKSGVNHATISGLVRGARASRETLKALAKAFGADERRLMRLAGYAVEPATRPVENVDDEPRAETVANGLSGRIYHKIERLSERDLIKLEAMLEVWVDDGREIGS